MIKQAYFRGLTKVAGGYSPWNFTTWHARKNPLSSIINPVADALYSTSPAGKAQKKLLQGGQLTADQDEAMQMASIPITGLQYAAQLNRRRRRPSAQQIPTAPKTMRTIMPRAYAAPQQKPVPAADPIPVTTPYGTATVRPTAAQVQAIQRAADTYDAVNGVLNGERPVTVPLPGGASADVQLGPKAVQAIDAYKDKAAQVLKGLSQRFRF